MGKIKRKKKSWETGETKRVRDEHEVRVVRILVGTAADLLLLILAIVLIAKLSHMAKDARFFTDECYHSYIIDLTAEEGRVPGRLPDIFFSKYGPSRNDQPPLMHWIGGIIAMVFGKGAKNYTNIVLLSAMIGATYTLMRLFINANAARLSILFLILPRLLRAHSVSMYLEMVTAMSVALGILLIYVSLRKKTVTWYIVAGLGVMTMLVSKITGIIVLPFCFVYFVYYAIRYLMKKETLLTAVGPVITVATAFAATFIFLLIATDSPRSVAYATFITPVRHNLPQLVGSGGNAPAGEAGEKKLMTPSEFWGSFDKKMVLQLTYVAVGLMILIAILSALAFFGAKLFPSRAFWIYLYFVSGFLIHAICLATSPTGIVIYTRIVASALALPVLLSLAYDFRILSNPARVAIGVLAGIVVFLLIFFLLPDTLVPYFQAVSLALVAAFGLHALRNTRRTIIFASCAVAAFLIWALVLSTQQIMYVQIVLFLILALPALVEASLAAWILVLFVMSFYMILFGPTEPRHYVLLIPLAAILGGYSLNEISIWISGAVFKDRINRSAAMRAAGMPAILFFIVLFVTAFEGIGGMTNYRKEKAADSPFLGPFDISPGYLGPIDYLRDNAPDDAGILALWTYSTMYYSGHKTTWPVNAKELQDLFFEPKPDDLRNRMLENGIDYVVLNNAPDNIRGIVPDDRYNTVSFPVTFARNMIELVNEGKADIVWPVSIDATSPIASALSPQPIYYQDLPHNEEGIATYVIPVSPGRGNPPPFLVFRLNIDEDQPEETGS